MFIIQCDTVDVLDRLKTNLEIYFYFVNECLPQCVCAPCIYSACEGQKKRHRSLGMEVEVVVNAVCLLGIELRGSGTVASAESSLQPLRF